MRFSFSLLKFLALLFLLPGLGALVVNASLATRDYASMPQTPDEDSNHIVPRIVHDRTVYLTPEQNQQLYYLHHYGAWTFAIGIGFGILYMGLMAFQLEKNYSAGGDDEDSAE